MSRFAADPHWLIYLPPTMSPSETTPAPGLLEHPAEAFAYFRAARASPRSSARRSTWARGRSSSSAATRTRRRGGSAWPTSEVGIVLHPHRAALLRRRRPGARVPRPGARGARRAPGSGTSSTTDWVVPRLRADAVVGQGAGAAARASTRAVGAAARRGAARRRWRRWRTAAGARRRRRATLARRGSRPRGDAGRTLRRRLPALLLAGRRPSTTCSWRRSTCWRPRGASHADQDHVWHMETLPRSARGRPGAAAGDAATAVVDLTDPASAGGGDRAGGRSSPRAAARGWSSSRCDFVARGPTRAGPAGA